MGKFLKFEKMITPIFIQIIFWLCFLISIISSVALIGYGVISSSGGFREIMAGFIGLLIAPIIIRIYCEMLIVIFKMQGALTDIRDSLTEPNDIERENKAI